MKRRSFTRGLMSLGLTPSLPIPAFGKSAVAAKASADHMYFMGWYTARLNKTCSPETLASELNLDTQTAREICERLIKSGTVSSPNAMGVSRALDPIISIEKRLKHDAAKKVIREKADTFFKEKLTLQNDNSVEEIQDVESVDDGSLEQKMPGNEQTPEIISDSDKSR